MHKCKLDIVTWTLSCDLVINLDRDIVWDPVCHWESMVNLSHGFEKPWLWKAMAFKSNILKNGATNAWYWELHSPLSCVSVSNRNSNVLLFCLVQKTQKTNFFTDSTLLQLLQFALLLQDPSCLNHMGKALKTKAFESAEARWAHSLVSQFVRLKF